MIFRYFGFLAKESIDQESKKFLTQELHKKQPDPNVVLLTGYLDMKGLIPRFKELLKLDHISKWSVHLALARLGEIEELQGKCQGLKIHSCLLKSTVQHRPFQPKIRS